jgi:type I restriction enzyme S subunit
MQNDCFPETPPEWDKGPISMIADINPRYPIKKGQELPFIEMAAVAEQFGGIQRMDWRKLEGSGLARFKVGDTLFAKITPCPENGKVAFVHELPAPYGIGSTEFIVLSPKANCDPRYLYHLVCAHDVRGRAASRMEGSTGRQRVPDDVFEKRLLVPVPPPEEQAAIARVLDAVDTAIERCEAAIQKARQLRKSLLSDLLSCGVDNNGRVPKRRDLDFVKTPLGRLPATWEISSVGGEFELQNGFTLNADRRPRFRKRKYLRVANVQRDALDLEDVQELEAHETEFALRVLQADDLLVVEGHADRMQIGRCAIVDERAVGFTFQNHLFRLRTRGRVVPGFGCLWLNSEYAQRFWNARCATSSGLNTINQRTLRKLLVPVPRKSEQDKIVELVQSQRTHLESLMAKRDSLAQLKKSLMQDLLTGAVRVKASLSQVAEAV